jgi:hypothetical protein
MTMGVTSLTFLAKVEVRADAALVSNASYWVGFAAIAADTLVDLLCLISRLLA